MKMIKIVESNTNNGDCTTPFLSPDYVPTSDEAFMNPIMLEYFRQKLGKWRKELVEELNETIHNLQENNSPEPDPADQASVDSQRAFELRTRERFYKLIGKIDQALERMDNGTYGQCLVTGENISIQRLEVRPIATMSIEAQEAHERNERNNKKLPLDKPI